MIHVDRTRVEEPTIFSSDRLREAFNKARAFYRIPPSKRLQRRHEFNDMFVRDSGLRETLVTLFNAKCAFCETKLYSFGPRGSGIEQFRPKDGAYELDGHLDPDHYWWLAYEWRNIYLICQECSASKGGKFPVRGQRVRVPPSGLAMFRAPGFWTELSKEQPLLLDPCSDDPDAHLIFDAGTGIVAGKTEIGKTTIEVFSLNRASLVKARHDALLAAEPRISSLASLAFTALNALTDPQADLALKDFVKSLRELMSPSTAFAGAQRQILRQWAQENEKLVAAASRIQPDVKDVLDELLRKRVPRSKRISDRAIIRKSLVERKKREEKRGRRTKLDTQYITRVEIHNFRVIRHIRLEFQPAQGEAASWMLLLGENGVGKSSILKAITLALMDKERLPKLGLNASNFVRYGCKSGYVKVHVTGYTKPFELSFRRGSSRFRKRNNNRLHTLLLGYGGTRLLPRDRHKPARSSSVARIENLFDPFLPLINAKSWLLSLKAEPFGYSARAIKDLLLRRDEDELIPEGGEVKLKLAPFRDKVPLEELSDGYQSMIALGADIMKVVMKTWRLAEKARGIVLIDEIDMHLHPRWKMQVVSSLRRAFPSVQFIVTTHDPLCLKDARHGEVCVLNRESDGGPIRATRVDVPPGATADQLLTGFWFGLSSTIDDETLALIKEHHRLLRDRKTLLNLRQIRRLEEELNRRLGVYADTSIDRMAQSVAAQLMEGVDYRSLGPQRRKEMRETIYRRVAGKVGE